MPPKKKLVKIQLILIVICCMFICFSFYRFSLRNHRFIYDNNTQYIGSATKQMARTINSFFETHLSYIRELSALFPHVIDQSSENGLLGTASLFVNNNVFQEMYFIIKDGNAISSTGKKLDMVNTELYQRGMKDTSGILFETTQLHKGILHFYAPVYSHKQIIGIISGLFSTDYLEILLENTFFEEPTQVVILDKQGDIITHSQQAEKLHTFFNKLNDTNIKTPEKKHIESMISQQTIETFRTNDHYIIAGYPITVSGFYLLHIFPDSINEPMFTHGLINGEILVLELLAVFIGFIIWLGIYYICEQKKLKKLTVEQDYIISNISSLFNQVFYINFEEDTFQTIFEQSQSQTPKYLPEVSKNIQSLLENDNVLNEDIDKLKILFSPVEIAEALLENDDQQFIEIEYRRIIDNITHWMRAEALVTQEKNGLPTGFLITTQDITRTKQDQDAIYKLLQDSYETAIAASNSKTNFLSRMSHDIRTPLNAIIGMTTIASKHIDDKTRVTSCLSKIIIASNHLLNLINEILDMSKIESGSIDIQAKQLNLKDVITNLITINQNAIQSKNQYLIPVIDKVEHEIVIGDEARLMQILMNLLSNSIKYTQQNGTITLTIRELPAITNDKADYEFIISDNGLGMKKEFLEHIFEPFKRATDTRVNKIEGTGLGMCITQNLVHLMKGNINVQSEFGKGTTFTIQLSFKLPAEQKSYSGSSLSGLSILIADDDVTVRELILHTATEIGLKCDAVSSGEEALTLVKNRVGIPYFAIFIDWQMSGIDGIETTRQLRKLISSTVPIIIISAFDMDEGFQKMARKAGVTGMIAKPLFKSSIVQTLEHCDLGTLNTGSVQDDQTQQIDLNRSRILIVEDNEINMEIACELVSSCNAEVDTAVNGRQAVEKYRQAPEGYYALILMDLQLPEMDGYEATREIRISSKNDALSIPIIAMTADAFAEDIKKTLAAGMNDHIAKPIDVHRLNKCLLHWLSPSDNVKDA